MTKNKGFSNFLFFFLSIFFMISLVSLNSGNLKIPLLSTTTCNPEDSTSKKDTNANKAVHINIKDSSLHNELEGNQAQSQKIFLILNTQWENIHPKQKIEKEKLEKKQDHTMGVKLLTEKKKAKQEYVYADVAYMVEKLADHIYCLADGLAYSLHPLTEQIQGGAGLFEPFTISKKGDVREVRFVFQVPNNTENLAFQFFDYEYGSILIPVQGSLQDARGNKGPPDGVLSHIEDDLVQAAAHSVSFLNEYEEEQAPDGWQYLRVHISGKSLSGDNIKNIVQIEPEEYIWIFAEGGYLYYAVGGTTTDDGFLRFTPEVFQSQEVFFLIPNSAKVQSLGIRIQNKVFNLPLVPEKESKIPDPAASHQDGDTMKIMVFSVEKTDSFVIIDLGIRSLVSSGIEIIKDQQFILIHEGQKIFIDDEFTNSLPHKPPSPFIIPPGTFVRFKLAYKTASLPSVLYFRGFESEKNIEIAVIKK